MASCSMSAAARNRIDRLLGPSARYFGHRYDRRARATSGTRFRTRCYFEGDSWPVGSESVYVILCTETLEHVLEPSTSRRGAPYAPSRRKASADGAVRGSLAFRPERLLALHARPSLLHLLEKAGFTETSVSMRAATHSPWPATRPSLSCFRSSSRSTAGHGPAPCSCSQCSQSRSSSALRLPLALLSSDKGARTASVTPSTARADVTLVFEDRLVLRCADRRRYSTTVRRGALRPVAARRDVLLLDERHRRECTTGCSNARAATSCTPAPCPNPDSTQRRVPRCWVQQQRGGAVRSRHVCGPSSRRSRRSSRTCGEPSTSGLATARSSIACLQPGFDRHGRVRAVARATQPRPRTTSGR